MCTKSFPHQLITNLHNLTHSRSTNQTNKLIEGPVYIITSLQSSNVMDRIRLTDTQVEHHRILLTDPQLKHYKTVSTDQQLEIQNVKLTLCQIVHYVVKLTPGQIQHHHVKIPDRWTGK